jgi:RNA polymerase sigma-70 factor (family 1)
MIKTTFSQSVLIAHLKEGSQTALKNVYATFGDTLYINILKLVKDQTVAREILQDVFVRLWINRQKLEGNNLGGYLFTISANCVSDYYRALKQNHAAKMQLIQTASAAYTHVEEQVFTKETAGQIKAAINSLPEKRRQVFELCKVRGKSYAEVSALLGISVSTINDHIVKATRTIRQHLDSPE